MSMEPDSSQFENLKGIESVFAHCGLVWMPAHTEFLQETGGFVSASPEMLLIISALFDKNKRPAADYGFFGPYKCRQFVALDVDLNE